MKTLKRKQIYLDEDCDRVIKQISAKIKVSEAEIIRRAIKDYIKKNNAEMTGKDPLLSLIGMCDNPEGSTDTSIHHDKYLYGKKG